MYLLYVTSDGWMEADSPNTTQEHKIVVVIAPNMHIFLHGIFGMRAEGEHRSRMQWGGRATRAYGVFYI